MLLTGEGITIVYYFISWSMEMNLNETVWHTISRFLSSEHCVGFCFPGDCPSHISIMSIDLDLGRMR